MVILDQQVARFDRIVAFAFASTGADKFVTNRVVFNIGQQKEMPNGRTLEPQPVRTQVLRTPSVEPMEMVSLSTDISGNQHASVL